MNFITHHFNKLFSEAALDCEYNKPAICPHCSISCDPIIVAKTYCQEKKNDISSPAYVLLLMACTACHKQIAAVYKVQNKQSTFLGMYPQKVTKFYHEQLQQLSPRFMTMYNQALVAKDAELFDLAAIGYRSALEFLIKDYAINELNEDPKTVKKKRLNDIIVEYLKDVPMVNTADMVRFLGNDAVHYAPKYPQYDFQILDSNMQYFVNHMSAHIAAIHTPLKRQNKD